MNSTSKVGKNNRDLLWPREEPEPGLNRTIYLDSPLSPQNS